MGNSMREYGYLTQEERERKRLEYVASVENYISSKATANLIESVKIIDINNISSSKVRKFFANYSGSCTHKFIGYGSVDNGSYIKYMPNAKEYYQSARHTTGSIPYYESNPDVDRYFIDLGVRPATSTEKGEEVVVLIWW